jgi:hypothetical protein
MNQVLIYTQERGYYPTVYDISDKEKTDKAILSLFKHLDENQQFASLQEPEDQAVFDFAEKVENKQRRWYLLAKSNDPLNVTAA